MSQLEKLRKVKTLGAFAKLLGYKPNALAYIIYKIPNNEKYAEFSIPKKNGQEREIKAPNDKLKLIQRHLAGLLTECHDEICNIQNMKTLSHGFRRNHSIVTNALKHKNKRYVFNIDLEDFFPSFNFGRVRGFFIKNRNFNLDKDVATIIAQIACHNNELPQGSPCSPIISNLIGHLLDIRLVNLAKKSKCTYSRYADDLTFSTNNKNFPEIIAITNTANNWIAGKTLVKEIEKMGFIINKNKTSMQYKTGRQMTTGLIVNKKINIRKEYYKNARSMCHQLFKSNEFYFDIKQSSSEIHSDDNEISAKIKGTNNQLEGVLSFIYQVKKRYINRDTKELKDKLKNHPTGIIKLYKQFLFYKYFFILDKPLLICEGDTDSIYLVCALKQLKEEYPDLVIFNDKKYNFNFRFLKMSKTFREVFLIAPGTSGLVYLMKIYEKYMKLFKSKGKQYPVIVLIDNDEGSKAIKSIIKKKLELTNIYPNTNYYFCENLYVLFTTENENSEIEDLFDKKTLETVVNGKIFSRNKKIDDDKEFAKQIFAEKVIKVKQTEIDFSNFKPIFDKLRLIINDHSESNPEK